MAEKKKKVLITGVTGQDGAYLSHFLLEKGYEVHGLVRRSSIQKYDRIQSLIKDVHRADGFFLHYGDVTDSISVMRIISEFRPDEIYNLAAQSHVRVSFDSPEYTANADALGTLRILEAVRILGLGQHTKVYQASTSELFGNSTEIPQNEKTPFCPRSPYGIAKLYAFWVTKNYREAYNMFTCNGILFNHESPLRGENFVTRKITENVCKIALGVADRLYMGNLDAKRDWGYAKDYVEAMWKMLQLDVPVDLVIATGEAHSVREFCERAFRWTNVDIVWEGHGVNEKGFDRKTGQVKVEIDPYYFRPTEVDYLLGDASEARRILNWEPRVKFAELVDMMMEADFAAVKGSLR